MPRAGAAASRSFQYLQGNVSSRSHPRTRSGGIRKSLASSSLPHVLMISRLVCMAAIMESYSA